MNQVSLPDPAMGHLITLDDRIATYSFHPHILP